jgi:hypothetical protein
MVLLETHFLRHLQSWALLHAKNWTWLAATGLESRVDWGVKVMVKPKRDSGWQHKSPRVYNNNSLRKNLKNQFLGPMHASFSIGICKSHKQLDIWRNFYTTVSLVCTWNPLNPGQIRTRVLCSSDNWTGAKYCKLVGADRLFHNLSNYWKWREDCVCVHLDSNQKLC